MGVVIQRYEQVGHHLRGILTGAPPAPIRRMLKKDSKRCFLAVPWRPATAMQTSTSRRNSTRRAGKRGHPAENVGYIWRSDEVSRDIEKLPKGVWPPCNLLDDIAIRQNIVNFLCTSHAR